MNVQLKKKKHKILSNRPTQGRHARLKFSGDQQGEDLSSDEIEILGQNHQHYV